MDEIKEEFEEIIDFGERSGKLSRELRDKCPGASLEDPADRVVHRYFDYKHSKQLAKSTHILALATLVLALATVIQTYSNLVGPTKTMSAIQVGFNFVLVIISIYIGVTILSSGWEWIQKHIQNIQTGKRKRSD